MLRVGSETGSENTSCILFTLKACQKCRIKSKQRSLKQKKSGSAVLCVCVCVCVCVCASTDDSYRHLEPQIHILTSPSVPSLSFGIFLYSVLFYYSIYWNYLMILGSLFNLYPCILHYVVQGRAYIDIITLLIYETIYRYHYITICRVCCLYLVFKAALQ